MKNTYFNFTLNDDSIVSLTLNFAQLYKLRAQDKNLYDRYNQVIVKGAKDEFDNITILYTAFKCADLNNKMTYEEFIELVPINRNAINETIQNLLGMKKK